MNNVNLRFKTMLIHFINEDHLSKLQYTLKQITDTIFMQWIVSYEKTIFGEMYKKAQKRRKVTTFLLSSFSNAYL
jgi:hypothetical protein